MPSRRRRARGYIEQLPSGSYRAAVYAGVDLLTGKERYLRETTKEYNDALILLTKLQRQVDEDRHPKTAITVRQAITQWLEVAELEDTTRERYEDLIRLHILPTSATCRPANSTPSCWSASTPGCRSAGSCVPAAHAAGTPAGR